MEVEILEKSRRLRTARISLDMKKSPKLLGNICSRGLPWSAAGELPIRSRSMLEKRAAVLRVCFRLRLIRLSALDAVWLVRCYLVRLHVQARKNI
jgi:hypothetical protein